MITVLLVSWLSSCDHSPAKRNLPAGVHGVEVIQVLNTTKYTYLRVSEDKSEYWMAIVREEIKSGDSVYYSQAYDMKDFYSRELDRTFPSVLFVHVITSYSIHYTKLYDIRRWKFMAPMTCFLIKSDNYFRG